MNVEWTRTGHTCTRIDSSSFLIFGGEKILSKSGGGGKLFLSDL